MAYLYVNRQAPLNALRRELGLTAGNAATHLAKLSAAGYAETRRVLANVFEVRVFITDAGVIAFDAYIQRLRQLIDDVTPGAE